MKIVYISNSIIPSRYANSVHVMKMCQALADNGHDVTLLAPNQSHRYEKNVADVYSYYGVKRNFKIKKLPSPNVKGTSWIYSFFIWLFLLKNKNADLVYGRFLHGCFLATRMRMPVVFESHVRDFDKTGYQKKILSSVIESPFLEFLCVISQALKKMYVKEQLLPENKIVVAHDGADEVFDFSNKANLQGNKETLKVGYVGNLYQGKGVEVIEGVAPLLDSDVELHVIGGMESDINNWKKRIESKNVFFYGFIKQEEISKYINALDVCLLPNQKIVLLHGSVSKKDNISDFTSPIKMFDYMAHGKAIIASDLPVLKEVLSSENAVFCEPDDFSAWAQAINKYKDKELRKSKGTKALYDFKAYTWKKRAELLIKVLSNKN